MWEWCTTSLLITLYGWSWFKWGQRRWRRLGQSDKKATVTQITTLYNCSMQKRISERTTCWPLRQMGYNSRTPPQVSLLSIKNRNLRHITHRLTQTGQMKIGHIFPNVGDHLAILLWVLSSKRHFHLAFWSLPCPLNLYRWLASCYLPFMHWQKT